MKSVVGRDLEMRFERLAALLRHQPFEESTWIRFEEKWTRLVNEYEREHPGAVPPLLEYADNAWTTRVRWPRGWR